MKFKKSFESSTYRNISTAFLFEDVQKVIDYNKEKHGSLKDLSDTLHNATTKNIPKSDLEHIHRYTAGSDRDRTGSYRLNKALADGKDIHINDMPSHRAIMQHSKPSGHEFHAFSGTIRNFSKLAPHSKDGILHLPAHTSTSHSYHVAKHFAEEKMSDNNKDETHVLHIHIKPHDKILNTSHITEYHGEHESIIPAGTKIKHTGTSEHDGIHIHHFTIHSQE